MFVNRIIARQVASVPVVRMNGSCSSVLVQSVRRRTITTTTATMANSNKSLFGSRCPSNYCHQSSNINNNNNTNDNNNSCMLRRSCSVTTATGTRQQSSSTTTNNDLNKDQSSSQYSSSSSSSSSSSQYSSLTLIINAVGKDRVGIVHDMTKEVINMGGNVGASQAAKLGNYFSFMMLVNIPTSVSTIETVVVETLTTNLQNINDLTVVIKNTTDTCTNGTATTSGTEFTSDDESTTTAATATATTTTTTTTTAIGYRGRLILEGADNPGIVNKVTKILSNNGLNINTLETSDEVAPHGGTVLFRMKGTAHAYEPLSSGFDVAKIKQELTELGDDLNCDIDLIDDE